jgi:hypothetical protein
LNRTEVLQETIDTYYQKLEEYDKQIFSQLALYIYYLESQKTDSDLYVLAKIIPEDHVKKIINYFSSSEKGSTLKLPSIDEYRKAYLLGVCYFLKEIKKWEWTRIKDFLPLPEQYQEILSPISIGKKINQISENLNKELVNLLVKCDIHSVIKALEKVDVK